MNLTSRLIVLAHALLLPLLMLPAGAFAVSLGDELILSRLGDPVEVEVEVLQWEDMDLERVQISAASREEYEVFKLTWLPVLEHLNFNLVGPDLDGNVRVLISSRDPLDEPFLELLLVLRWPGGSLRREYVLLFDPPGAPVTIVPAQDAATADASPPAPATPLPALVMNVPQLPASEGARTATTAPAVQDEAPAPAGGVTLPIVEEEEDVATPTIVEAGNSTATPAIDTASKVETPPNIDAASDVATSPVVEVANNPAPPLPLPESAPRSVVTSTAPEPVAPPAAEAAPDSEVVAEAPESEPVQDARTQVAIEVETLGPQRAVAPLDTVRRTYQVRSGDSLWNIARQFRPAGAGENLYQMLLGIHDLNRNSFINGNISLLRANALLQMPSDADIAAIDAASAQAEFDRRWDAGTERFDAVQRGDAIPLFVNEVPEEAPAVTIEPALPPGTEAPPAPDDEGGLIMVSATNVVQPLQLALVSDSAPGQDADAEEEAAPAPLPTSAIPMEPEPQISAAEAPAEPEDPDISPAQSGEQGMDALIAADSAAVPPAEESEPATTPAPGSVTSTATASRIIATTELETELAAMRTRRETAEALARQLQDSLQRAQAERASQAALLGPQNLPLAGGAVALVLALVAGVVFMLKIAGELRVVRVNAAAARVWPRGESKGTERMRIEPKLEETARAEPSSLLEKAAEPPRKLDPREATDATQIEVIELDASHAANATAARGVDNPEDLFARMDDMLGSEQKSPQK